MEQFIPIFFVFTIVVIVATAFGLHQMVKTNRTLQILAARYGGTLSDGGLLQSPSIRFPHRDARGLLDFFSTGGKHRTHYTQVKLFGQIPRIRCEIYPEGFWTNLRRLIGVSDITIGYPRFDAEYVIKGDDDNGLRQVLSPAAQATIQQLRHIARNDDIYISISHGLLHVRKRSRIHDLPTLDRLMQLTIQLYDIIEPSSNEGISFATPGEVEVAVHEAICQVCGEAVRDDAVLCRKCQTPHHRECWHYYGACSTYGCREQRYHVPR